MNKPAAELNNDLIHNEALQAEIFDLLSREGPMTNGTVADVLGMSPWKCRPHLDEMKARGEIKYNLLGGRYSL